MRAAIKHCYYYWKSFLELNSKTPTIHVIIWDAYVLSVYENTKWLASEQMLMLWQNKPWVLYGQGTSTVEV